MNQFRCSFRMLLGISLFALSIEPAQAQSIDYGSLEALFGEPVTTGATQDYLGAGGVATLKPWDNAGLRLSLGGNVNEEFETGLSASQERNSDDFSKISFNGDGLVQITDNVQARFEASHSAVEETDVTPRWNISYSDYHVTSLKGDIASETNIGLINLTAYTNQITMKNTNGAALFRFDNRTDVMKLENLFKVGADHTFRLGTEYR